MTSSILIIKPSSFGDILHTLPSVYLLREKFPEAHIGWIAKREYVSFLEEVPYIDEVIPFDRQKYRLSCLPCWIGEFGKFVRSFQRRFEVAIDFQGLFRSGLMAFFSRASRRIGFASGKEGSTFFYTEKVSPSSSIHAIDQYGSLLNPLGIHDLPSPEIRYLSVPPRWESQAQEKFPRIFQCPQVLSLVVGARWPSKLWPLAKFASLIEGLKKEIPPLEFILLGSPSESPLAEELQRQVSFPLFDCIGQTSLWELGALLSHSRLLISGDTGPLHLASLLKVPSVALLGPNRREYIRPFGCPHKIASAPVDCLGCEQVTCPLPVHRCMEELDGDAVLEGALDLLGMDGGEG